MKLIFKFIFVLITLAPQLGMAQSEPFVCDMDDWADAQVSSIRSVADTPDNAYKCCMKRLRLIGKTNTHVCVVTNDYYVQGWRYSWAFAKQRSSLKQSHK